MDTYNIIAIVKYNLIRPYACVNMRQVNASNFLDVMRILLSYSLMVVGLNAGSSFLVCKVDAVLIGAGIWLRPARAREGKASLYWLRK